MRDCDIQFIKIVKTYVIIYRVNVVLILQKMISYVMI